MEDRESPAREEKRARLASDANPQREIRYDFIQPLVDQPTSEMLLPKLHSIKQQLNQVKAQLSDQDIAEWNRSASVASLPPRLKSLFRHTAYMNAASTIVPHLREQFQVEVGTQAWGKMFEILSQFDLIHSRSEQPWRSLHLCEAPGAFISALNHFLQTRSELLHLHLSAARCSTVSRSRNEGHPMAMVRSNVEPLLRTQSRHCCDAHR